MDLFYAFIKILKNQDIQLHLSTEYLENRVPGKSIFRKVFYQYYTFEKISGI
jgi:hypothetical protein